MATVNRLQAPRVQSRAISSDTTVCSPRVRRTPLIEPRPVRWPLYHHHDRPIEVNFAFAYFEDDPPPRRHQKLSMRRCFAWLRRMRLYNCRR